MEILQGILIWRLFGGFKEYLFEPSGIPGGSAVKAACSEDEGSIPGSEDPLEKEMLTLSCTLTWKIPWTKEPRGLQSMGSKKSGTT